MLKDRAAPGGHTMVWPNYDNPTVARWGETFGGLRGSAFVRYESLFVSQTTACVTATQHPGHSSGIRMS